MLRRLRTCVSETPAPRNCYNHSRSKYRIRIVISRNIVAQMLSVGNASLSFQECHRKLIEGISEKLRRILMPKFDFNCRQVSRLLALVFHRAQRLCYVRFPCIHAAANTPVQRWAYSSLNSPSHFRLLRYGGRSACTSSFSRLA